MHMSDWLPVRNALCKWLATTNSPIECAREIAELRMASPEPDSEHFYIFRAIDSETEEFPLGSQRALWSTESLASMDIEREKYLHTVSSDFWEACRNFLAYIVASEKATRGGASPPPNAEP